MSIEVWWPLHLDDKTKEVTSPHPWIDSDGLVKLGELWKNHLCRIAQETKKLQKLGWVLKIAHGNIVVRHNGISSPADADKSFKECGINTKGLTVVVDETSK